MASVAEVVIADDAVRVDEVQRRPVAVRERTPDLVVVVDRDRVVDRALPRRASHAVDLVLEGELGRVDADDDQPNVSVGPRPRAHVRRLTQPVDARPRPEVDENDMVPQLGGAAWPAAAAMNRPNSQYQRAAEGPVPVSQYSVMLSRMVSRVRLPTGSRSTNAREILW